MQVPVYDTSASELESLILNDSVFGIEPNVAVMHQAHTRQLANQRLGTHQTKTRGMVRGGGRKPWRQKGTGRARQGTIRAPQWRGGGVVFGPHPRSYQKKMNKKMRRLAIRSALSVKAQEESIVVVSGLSEVEPQTRVMVSLLEGLPVSERSVLIVIGPDGEWDEFYRAVRNIENVKVIRANVVNVHDVLKYDTLLLTTEAVEHIHNLWATG